MRVSNFLLKATRRLPMTSKQGHNYYKGTQTGNVGRHTKHGGFQIDWDKVRTYVVPKDLNACKLRPLVSRNVKATHGRFPDPKGPLSGRAYLEKWKDESGELE